jgi:hypothetical protein
MRLILVLLALAIQQPDDKLARVVDPDGHTDVRSGQGTTFDIVGRVTTEDFFYCEPTGNNDWRKIRLLRPLGQTVTGYIPKSKIQLIESMSYKEQSDIILRVLSKEKQFADNVFESHRKYNSLSKKWNRSTDSILYNTTARNHSVFSETSYSAILKFLPKTFCKTKTPVIINSLFATIWSGRMSANEERSSSVAMCFACAPKVLSQLISQLENKEQKKLIIDDIETGLRNNFSVTERETSNTEFLNLTKQLELLRVEEN